MSNHDFILCNWYNHINVSEVGIVTKRCTTKCISKSIYCEKHTSLKNDFKLVVTKKLCSSYKNIEITPSSYRQIESCLVNNNYNILDKQYITEPYETYADFSDETKIVLDNDETYYYTTNLKKEKSMNIRVNLKKYCTGVASIFANDILFCKDCYEKKVAHKIAGPTINTIINEHNLNEKLKQLIIKGEYIDPNKKINKELCTSTTTKGTDCTYFEYCDGVCKKHYNMKKKQLQLKKEMEEDEELDRAIEELDAETE